jgi:hypothetical protein
MQMTNLREAAQMALDALESCYDVFAYPANGNSPQDEAIDALRAALAQPEQEPVAWLTVKETCGLPKMVVSETQKKGWKPVYTSPPQRKEWQGLTDEEIVENALQEVFSAAFGRGAKWAESKLKEKNYQSVLHNINKAAEKNGEEL